MEVDDEATAAPMLDEDMTAPPQAVAVRQNDVSDLQGASWNFQGNIVQLLECIGSGSFGKFYTATCEGIQGPTAVKQIVFAPQNVQARDAALREAALLETVTQRGKLESVPTFLGLAAGGSPINEVGIWMSMLHVRRPRRDHVYLLLRHSLLRSA